MASRESAGITPSGMVWYDVNTLGAREEAEVLRMHKEQQPKQQEFATGATRSADDHKIDFEGHISPEALHFFGEYMHTQRIQRDGKTRASDNWQEGIPLHKYVKSLMRHSFDLWRAWRGTVTHNPDTGQQQTMGNLCAAILFNVQGLLHELIAQRMTSWTHLSKEQRQRIEQGTFVRPERKPDPNHDPDWAKDRY